jgi:hypothetical protein
MWKLFAAVAAILGFAVVGIALIADHSYTRSGPAEAQLSIAEQRQQIVSDVIDGRLPLLEGAAAFRDLNRQTPAVADLVAETYPGETEGERACQQLLTFVRRELEMRSKDSDKKQASEASTDSAGVLARLQAEFEKARDDGKVHLLGEAS